MLLTGKTKKWLLLFYKITGKEFRKSITLKKFRIQFIIFEKICLGQGWRIASLRRKIVRIPYWKTEFSPILLFRKPWWPSLLWRTTATRVEGGRDPFPFFSPAVVTSKCRLRLPRFSYLKWNKKRCTLIVCLNIQRNHKILKIVSHLLV